MKIAALAGGVGAARFLSGLVQLVRAEDLTIVVNTGDDFRWMGLYVCPDLDTVTYTLGGLANPETGWGVRTDTFQCLNRLIVLGGESWFRIGDIDLATHLFRTRRMHEGVRLSEITAEICIRNGLGARILPMSDEPVPTLIHTDKGVLEFQDYFVKQKCRPRVLKVDFSGVEESSPAPGIMEALSTADAIVICPSNPFISIGPILAIPGLREAIRRSQAPAVAISPMIGAHAVKGPTAAMLLQMGHEVSAVGVAAMYADLADVFVLDRKDEALLNRIESIGPSVRLADTLMDSLEASTNLAEAALGSLL